jgi:hypothetical protein
MSAVLFEVGMNYHDSAIALLSHSSKSSKGIWRVRPGSQTRSEIALKQQPHSNTHHGAATTAFTSHRSVTLPDTCNGHATAAYVHQFVLPPGRAEEINRTLRLRAATKYGGSDGLQLTNEGGYHSTGEIFDRGASDVWYRQAHDLVLSAMAIIEPDWAQGSADVANSLEVTGWLNASGAHDFNRLHHHGEECVWSAIYYADDGAGSDRPGAPLGDADDGLRGALLLQTQPVPSQVDYHFYPVTPVPGTLWLFPAHLMHAVMPRVLHPGVGGAAVAIPKGPMPVPVEMPLRVSVACNMCPPLPPPDGSLAGARRPLRRSSATIVHSHGHNSGN